MQKSKTVEFKAIVLGVDSNYEPVTEAACRYRNEYNSARAYFGYSENFKFTLKYADIFFECDAAIDKGLADGLTAEEVHEKVTALFQERIDDLAEINGVAAATLLYNLEILCTPVVDPMFGDRNARLIE